MLRKLKSCEISWSLRLSRKPPQLLKSQQDRAMDQLPQIKELTDTRHAWYAGYRDAFSDLHKLTKLQNTNNTQPTAEEWMHIQKPQQ